MADKNPDPYFSHGVGFAGFCHNLQLGRPESCGALFHKGYEPQRLAAIAQQASNIKGEALRGLKTVGVLLAIAQTTGELPSGTVSSAGWLVEFLAEMAEDTSVFSTNATWTLEHGSFLGGEK